MFNSVKNFFNNCAATFQKLRNLTSANGSEESAGVQLQNLNIHSIPQSEKKGLFSSHTMQWNITPMNDRAVQGDIPSPSITLNNVSPFEAFKLIHHHSELLETTCEHMQSIDPSKLKEEDAATMTALRETVDDPKTPQSLKEAVKQKVIDASIAISPKAIECDYAIPANIVDKICSDKNGAYAVRYNAPMEGFEVKLQKDETRSKALQESRKGIVESFTQSNGTIDQNLTEKLQAYGEKMIEPLMIAKEKYPFSEQELKTELRAFGQKAAQVLQEELQNYKGDTASLNDCLQAYEKKMRTFINELLKTGQSSSTVNQEGNYLYCDMPVDIEVIKRHDYSPNEFNTVAVVNTCLQEPLTDKTLDGLNKELKKLREQLTDCKTNEQLQTIEERYQEVNKEIENRSQFREQCLTNLATMQAFGLPEGDDPFDTRTTPATKHLTQMKLLFERTDKEQGKYSAELAKAQERLDVSKTSSQPQDSASSTIAAQ